jgi:hypothetical protein
MVDMIATKRLKYGTRRLLPGDPFAARHDRDAKLLIGIGKARYATRDMVATDEPAVRYEPVDPRRDTMDDTHRPVETPADTDERPALRAEYEAKFGKRPFPGWSADVLREKLAAE